jgi:hypothetical protein
VRQDEPFVVVNVGTRPLDVVIDHRRAQLAPGERVEGDRVTIDPPVRIVRREGARVDLSLE